MSYKSELQKAVNLQTQYEKLLEEYAEFLETAQNKLRGDTVTALNLPHLTERLHSHKVSIIQ